MNHAKTTNIAHRMAVKYPKTRKTFGALLATRQAIQWILVDLEIEIRTCRWLVWEAAWKYDTGEDLRQEALPRYTPRRSWAAWWTAPFIITAVMGPANGCPWSAGIARPVSAT